MRTRRVLVTGGSGQLGRAFQSKNRPGWEVIALPSSILDVRDWRVTRDTVSRLSPDLVIHAGAATNVDRCEQEPDWAYAVNALGTRQIARATAAIDAELVYVSTNYVFDGTKSAPYHEFDQPKPISVYGASKLAGEHEALAASSRCHVIRTASVYAESGTNFVATMLRLMERRDSIDVVDDQSSNPTYAGDLARAIAEIVDHMPYGICHATNSGTASWHEWAVAIRDHAGADCNVRPISAAEYQRLATPPANGCMRSLSLESVGITLPDWRDSLHRCLDTMIAGGR